MSERRVAERQRYLIVVSIINGTLKVVSVELSEVVIIEFGTELLQEVIEGDDGLIAQIGELMILASKPVG